MRTINIYSEICYIESFLSYTCKFIFTPIKFREIYNKVIQFKKNMNSKKILYKAKDLHTKLNF